MIVAQRIDLMCLSAVADNGGKDSEWLGNDSATARRSEDCRTAAFQHICNSKPLRGCKGGKMNCAQDQQHRRVHTRNMTQPSFASRPHPTWVGWSVCTGRAVGAFAAGCRRASRENRARYVGFLRAVYFPSQWQYHLLACPKHLLRRNSNYCLCVYYCITQ